ncbi:MAG: ABC transporter substrate-binding protein [Thermodesulfobacteriota bacterium]|nr:ABC transporter substrate-binding protein [Thermodesulfobacteriota bacterium]
MIQKCSQERTARLFLSVSMSFMCTLIFIKASFSEGIRGVTDTTIKIACAADQTGPIADIGIMLGEAPKHYIRYINEQGGINGRTIKYSLEDDRYSIPVGIAAFKKLVFRDKVFAMMGPYNTGTIKALFGQIEKRKVPVVAFPAHPSLVDPPKPYLFLNGEAYDDDLGVIFEYIIKELKPKDLKMAFRTQPCQRPDTAFAQRC